MFKYVEYTENFTVPNVTSKSPAGGNAQQHGLAAVTRTKAPIPGTKTRRPQRSGS
ncbi:hypothetical protein OHA72_27935 [Dactylosporangium sp. NBC_01737]|uniref:hypothetical protein n=1 Tax=Dactylosporangium sp. NBC_01737 TaxID=2975959 RepID=UPI002E121C1F|nr:hypothetical protein OHA72_27935 [Dactylosporangium sp. NBC_01737]